MKKYLVALTLLPLSANGALSLFTQLPKLARLVQVSDQQALLSYSKQLCMPIKPTPNEAVLREAVLRDLDEQKIALTDIDPHEEDALYLCTESLLRHAEYYNKYGSPDVAFSWLPREETIKAVAAYLQSLK